MPKQKPLFRDFTLLEITHLPFVEPAQLSPEMRAQGRALLTKKIEFGKRAIEQHTAPGDLILLETPEQTTFQQFQNAFPAITGSTTPGELQQLWKEFYQHHFNLYFELAQFARQAGRQVASIEYGVRSRGSRLERAASQIDRLPPETAQRVYLLMTIRREKGMQKKIETKKPAMVITASAHTIYLEHAIKPRQVIYQEPRANDPIKKGMFLEQRRWEKEEYLKAKKIRQRERRRR